MSDVTVASTDLSLLAPKFRAAVEQAVSACLAAGLEVKVHEAFRSQARQAWLFAQGRTRPGDIVTNAPTSLTSWHGYGLAVDVIHKTRAYWPAGRGRQHVAANEQWFRRVGQVYKEHGLSWGGDWRRPDTPHMQWGRCTASPTEGAKQLMRTQGAPAVWRSLDAV